MIRKLVLTLMFVFMVSTMAVAADGFHADLDMTIKMDPAMFGGMEDTAGMDEMNFTGQLYWTDDAMRFEMDMGMFGGSVTTIIDYAEMIAYTLDDEAKTAMELDLAEQAAMMEESGIPDFQPEQMFTNWEDSLAMLKQMSGVTLDELGKESISGRACEKIDIVMDMTAMMGEDDISQEELDENEAMGMAGTFAGTFWIDEEYNLPIRMDMNMMGTDITWLLSGIADWKADAALLSVPADYKIMTFDDMMAEMMEGMEPPE